MEHTEESRAFRAEADVAAERQEEGLEEISKGLHTLKGLAGDMGEELKKQDPLIDAIDHKVHSIPYPYKPWLKPGNRLNSKPCNPCGLTPRRQVAPLLAPSLNP